MNSILFEKINKLCKQRNITITELERILQFGNGTIHRWKQVQPSLEKTKNVADFFGVTIDFLISENKEVPSIEVLELVKEYESLTPNQKALVKCYFTIIKNGQAV